MVTYGIPSVMAEPTAARARTQAQLAAAHLRRRRRGEQASPKACNMFLAQVCTSSQTCAAVSAELAHMTKTDPAAHRFRLRFLVDKALRPVRMGGAVPCPAARGRALALANCRYDVSSRIAGSGSRICPGAAIAPRSCARWAPTRQ